MRAFNPSTVARAGASAARNVGFRHRSNLSSKITCSSISSVRHKSHTTEPNMATTWAQHPLKSPKPSNGSSSPVLSSSKIPPKTHTAYIALGSNLGDRIEMIEKACNEMSARGIKIKRTSSLWETEPMYVLDQGNFVNGACEVRSC
jgi:2-amino-4-hydroxy-6-hydroxymethyldihydropteridine diphosphokinase/dihydropteroate synthase